MESLLDRFKREQGGLRRSRSVRASLRLIGNRWRSTKDEEPTDDIEIKRNSVVLTQIWSADKELDAYTGIDGTYKPTDPAMARKKPEVKQRRKSGDIDLNLKPQRVRKAEKSKFSDLFTNKKQKSKDLLVPEKIPPKAAAILHIHSPDKGKKKLKGIGKSESAKSVTDVLGHRRTRRGSEGDTCPNQPRGCVNPAFVYSTPPKERKLPMSPSAYLSTYKIYIQLFTRTSRMRERFTQQQLRLQLKWNYVFFTLCRYFFTVCLMRFFNTTMTTNFDYLRQFCHQPRGYNICFI